jgi:ABC-type multidrug transport system fused ATPase/permease subunit
MERRIMETAIAVEPASQRQEVMERLFTDLQRERLNVLYYQARAAAVRRWIIRANIVAALAASTALGTILKSSAGAGAAVLWVLTGLAAVSAAIVPILSLADKYARLEQAARGHTLAYERLFSLLRDLKLSEVGEAHIAREKEIEALRESLSALDEKTHERLLRSCWARVEKEIPAENAWTII